MELKGVDAIDNKLDNLVDFQKNADKYSIDALMESKDVVIDMNFDEQLWTGVDSDNVPIMEREPYSPATIFIKNAKGQPTDRVTLRDEGDFYSGGDLKRLNDTEAEIISTDKKSNNLQDRYGEEILGLTPDNMDEIREHYIKPLLIDKLEN